MKTVFVDTSAWYALVDRMDADHQAVVPPFEELRNRLVTSNYVLDEAITLIRFRLGTDAALSFGSRAWTGQLARIERTSAKDEQAAWKIFEQYKDHALSFTDCTSFAIMERIGTSTALALDSDFRAYGLECLP